MRQLPIILALSILTAAHAPAMSAQPTEEPAGQATPVEQCSWPRTRMCLQDVCSCVAPSNSGGFAEPGPQCVVTVGYPEGRPDAPWLQFSGADCAMNADIALAVSLASLLRSTGHAIPAPKR